MVKYLRLIGVIVDNKFRQNQINKKSIFQNHTLFNRYENYFVDL